MTEAIRQMAMVGAQVRGVPVQEIRREIGSSCATRYLLVTPDLHSVHHSARWPETDSNFGAVFPIWDIVYRTFRPEPQGGFDGMRIGLDEVRGRRANQLVWLLRSPFARELPRDESDQLAGPEPVLRLPAT